MPWKGSRPDAENPEWTAKEIRAARPLVEAHPEVVEAMLRYRGQRGPQKAPTKEMISLRVDRDVVEAFRKMGRGWQTRANDALREYARNNRRRAPSSKKRKTAKRAHQG